MSTRLMGLAWDVLETAQFSTVFHAQLNGDLGLRVILDKSSLYALVYEASEASSVYLCYEWTENRTFMIIYGIGSFLDCCRMCEYKS